MPAPPGQRDAASNPWPTYPMVMRVSSAHEEGGERLYSVNTERFVGDDDGNLRALLIHDVERVDGRFQKVEGTERELPADLVFLAMGFTGAQRTGLVETLGRRAGPARQHRPRRRVHVHRPRRLRRR
jgi:glutamate synthase (NADPH/NADH) small chain